MTKEPRIHMTPALEAGWIVVTVLIGVIGYAVWDEDLVAGTLLLFLATVLMVLYGLASIPADRWPENENEARELLARVCMRYAIKVGRGFMIAALRGDEQGKLAGWQEAADGLSSLRMAAEAFHRIGQPQAAPGASNLHVSNDLAHNCEVRH